ncbi:fused response regulator/phosphatase [Pseudonocardia kujensis]|uniref:fused response regulator/phosphatase n=1 Tax=Pseudonocardia kujensis TaxID=1128675 RepID=UPI001E63EFC7|nr:fused response regulator/phosphatase [Pseudonocardia kujensis]MCE0764511.1 fused response regulator/phosphatase [Pseudonocardia kujensis]
MTGPETAPDVVDGTTILVVDDNAGNRYVAASWLRRAGYRVVEATTGTEALDRVARDPIDVVLLDVGLPDMSGFEVCERIKSDPVLSRPVIHLSATAIRGQDRAQGLTRGADAYLVEPVEPDELRATVWSVLRYHRARAAAERLADRLAGLSRATMAMNAAVDFDELATTIASGAAALAEVPAAALVAASDRTVRRAVVDPADPDDTPRCDSVSSRLLDRLAGTLPDGPAAVAWAEAVDGEAVDGEAVDGEAVDGEAGEPASALRFGFRAGRVAIVLRTPQLGTELRDLLAQLGNAAALAVDSLQLYVEEHTLALTLQRAFLPSGPVAPPGLEVAVRYVPAAQNTEIGGDFYEVVELGEGRLLLAIGDVSGHSIHAATVMVELRHALRAYAVEGHGPAAILQRLEDLLRRYHPREFATVCVMVLDTVRDVVTVANAGHLAPLLASPEGTVPLAARGPMLGLRRPHGADSVLALPPRWTLVLYTDGLVEKRGVDLDAALEDLRTAVSVDPAPEELGDRLLARFAGVREDDIALLILRGGA